jgi:ferric-dicitrate binding protein FerR (iron transport regulator)
MKTDHYFDILAGKFLSGNASQEEIALLEKLMQESDGDRKAFELSRKAWETGKVWIPKETTADDKNRVQSEISKHVYLQLQRIRRRSVIYKIAAILAIPLTLAVGRFFFKADSAKSEESTFCEISAPKGHIAKCILPDKSEVWLNTGSSVRYDITGFNREKREIYLDGEAFFTVAKDSTKPFKVVTGIADVEVTGTSFNVKAIGESGIFETVLAEGSVNLTMKKWIEQKVELRPNDRVVFDPVTKKLSVHHADVEMYTCWRKGEILFKDATLNDLIKELERIYDIRFRVSDPKLGETRFRGMFGYNNNIISALEKIKKTADIDYRIENKEVILSRK